MVYKVTGYGEITEPVAKALLSEGKAFKAFESTDGVTVLIAMEGRHVNNGTK